MYEYSNFDKQNIGFRHFRDVVFKSITFKVQMTVSQLEMHCEHCMLFYSLCTTIAQPPALYSPRLVQYVCAPNTRLLPFPPF